MIHDRAFPPLGEKDCCRLPQAWQDQIVSKFERLEISPFPERGPYNKDPQEWRDRCLPKYAGLLHLLELTAVHPSTNARIAELLSRKLKLALRPSSSLASDEVHFIVSQGFHAYLRMSKASDSIDTSLSPLLRAAVPRFAHSIGFLKALLAYEMAQKDNSKTSDKAASASSESSGTEEDPATESLVENLSSPSHDIRHVSLQLLKHMNELGAMSECVDVMIQVEETPLALDQTRTIAMLLRKLVLQYGSVDTSTWLKVGIPRFMFGMLTVKLSPVWDDAVEGLKQLVETKFGEQAVSEIAFQWLDRPSMRWTPPSSDGSGGDRPVYTDFECTALQGLERAANAVLEMTEKADDKLLGVFDTKQQLVDAFAPTARSRGLKVLNAIPSVAEKRSRQLIPYFLSWATEEEEVDATVIGAHIQSQGSTWSLNDRKLMLGVFAQFVTPGYFISMRKFTTHSWFSWRTVTSRFRS